MYSLRLCGRSGAMTATVERNSIFTSAPCLSGGLLELRASRTYLAECSLPLRGFPGTQFSSWLADAQLEAVVRAPRHRAGGGSPVSPTASSGRAATGDNDGQRCDRDHFDVASPLVSRSSVPRRAPGPAPGGDGADAPAARE